MKKSCLSTLLCKHFLTRNGVREFLDIHGLTMSVRNRSSNSSSQAVFDTQTAQVKLWTHTLSTQMCAVAPLGGSNTLRTVRAMTVSPDGLYIAFAEDDDSAGESKLVKEQVGFLS